MIQTINSIKIVGNIDIKLNAIKPFDKLICEFLDTLSKEIKTDKEARRYTDLLAFSFWIRIKIHTC